MSFIDPLFEDIDEKGFTRNSLEPYEAILGNMKIGKQVTLVIETGEIKPGKNKGEAALKHERLFRQVASQMGVGLKVGHTVMPGNQTRLKIGMVQKREFSPETMKKRDAANAKRRAASKAAKEAAAKEAAPKAPAPAAAKAG